MLQPGGFLKRSKDLAHNVDNLAQRCESSHGIEDVRHRIFCSLARDSQVVESLADGPVIARPTQFFEA